MGLSGDVVGWGTAL